MLARCIFRSSSYKPMIRFTHVKNLVASNPSGSNKGPYARPKYLSLASAYVPDEIETINAGGQVVRPWRKVRLDPAFKPNEDD
jgi:hypothetical protein